jgi:hypothetical protein
MESLREHKYWDEFIKRELKRCRVPLAEVCLPSEKVPYTLIGEFAGPFTFIRKDYYWIVTGPVPLEVAFELHADPVVKDDIRVSSPSGSENAQPEDRAMWLVPKDSLEITSEDDEFDISEINALPGWYQVYFDDPESRGARQYVTEYRIDSEIGLRVFVDTLWAHSLVAEPVAA